MSTKRQFLKDLGSKTVRFKIGGIDVMMRSIKSIDVYRAGKWAKEYCAQNEGLDENQLATYAIAALSIVEPKLELDDAIELMNLQPGPAMEVLKRAIEINGLGGKEVSDSIQESF